MTNVDCNAKTCGYNENNTCKKKQIDVEGLFAKSKIGTFCQSFINPNSNKDVKQEIANEMSVGSTTSVSCSANYCKYNEENFCKARDITIGNQNAQYRSETQCDSFSLRK